MIIQLPATIRASIPAHYVRLLNEANVARIESAPALRGHSIDVSVLDSELRWQHSDRCLHVNVAALQFASLSVGSHGPGQFVFLALHFGDAGGGGVRMLNPNISDAYDFDEIQAYLASILPCELHDIRKGRTR